MYNGDNVQQGGFTMSEQINTLDEAYAEGFIAKCAEIGVDPEAVAKAAECGSEHGSSGEAYADISKSKPKKVKVKKVKEAFAKLAAFRNPQA